MTGRVDRILRWRVGAGTGPGGRSAAFLVSCSYDTATPYGVSFLFPGGERWEFARDLLADGLTSPAPADRDALAAGDVEIRPIEGDRVALALHDPAQPGTVVQLTSPVSGVREFLAATYQLVPRGSEAEHLDLDALVELLLSAPESGA